MDLIDLTTLRITIILTSVVCMMALIAVWRINRNLPGVVQWVWGVSLNAITFLVGLTTTMGLLALPAYTFLTNVITLTAAAILLEGCLRFRGFTSEKRWKLIFLLVPVFMLAIWLNMDNTVRRYLFHDTVAIVLLLGASVTMLWRVQSRDELRVYGLTAIFSTLMASVFVFRWITAWTNGFVTPESQMQMNAIIFVGVLVYIIGLSFSVVAACYFKSHQNVLQLAWEDTLTGLPNRRRIDETLNRTLSQARRSAKRFAVVVMDLNEFKQVNDTLGHAAGDALLMEVGKRLTDFVRESDFVGRLGGDEFLLILGDMDDKASVDTALERLRNQIEGEASLFGNPVTVCISIGLAMWPVDGDSLDGLLRTADRRMYTEKHQQRA